MVDGALQAIIISVGACNAPSTMIAGLQAKFQGERVEEDDRYVDGNLE